MKNIRSYNELILLPTFEERFEYLQLNGEIGSDTFGFDRYVNQRFYKSSEWRKIRDQVILRDNGCDMGLQDHEIFGHIYIHHMNPIRLDDIVNVTDILLNPDYLICVSHETHNAIHYGTNDICNKNQVIERKPNDTCPWKNRR